MLTLRRVLRSPNFRTYVTKPRDKKIVQLKTPTQDRTPLISCKVSKFNQYVETVVPEGAKFGTIPLASSGWQHYKAKGDQFTIHAVPNRQTEAEVTNKSFADLQLNEKLIENLKLQLDVTKPNIVQCEAFASMVTNNHTLIAAETGCGKTLAYLMPIVQRILSFKAAEENEREMNTPLVVVLTPGRELAEQIGDVAKKLCYKLNVNVKTVLGGKTKKLMMNPEFESVDILVGSMGVVSKLVTTGVYRMQCVRHVVIDEADTMFDDSFADKLVYFMRRFPFHRNQSQDKDLVGTQLVLASATMPTNTDELLQSVIDPSTVHEVASPNLHRILPNVTQKFIRMSKMHRPIQLLSIVKKELDKKRPMIVFSNRSATSDYVSLFLNEHGIECVNLNGDMQVHLRLGLFEKFQNGELNVLSTTDVISRGLDTTQVRHVVNFDFPLHIADYIHRIGRIGRLGSPENCQVTNFVSGIRELDVVQKIEHAARTSESLRNVNANITNIITSKIIKTIENEEKDFFSNQTVK